MKRKASLCVLDFFLSFTFCSISTFYHDRFQVQRSHSPRLRVIRRTTVKRRYDDLKERNRRRLSFFPPGVNAGPIFFPPSVAPVFLSCYLGFEKRALLETDGRGRTLGSRETNGTEKQHRSLREIITATSTTTGEINLLGSCAVPHCTSSRS